MAEEKQKQASMDGTHKPPQGGQQVPGVKPNPMAPPNQPPKSPPEPVRTNVPSGGVPGVGGRPGMPPPPRQPMMANSQGPVPGNPGGVRPQGQPMLSQGPGSGQPMGGVRPGMGPTRPGPTGSPQMPPGARMNGPAVGNPAANAGIGGNVPQTPTDQPDDASIKKLRNAFSSFFE